MIDKIDERLSENWRGNIPDFTDHGRGHSNRVLERLESILPKQEERTAKLEKQMWWGSILLLLYATELHDVGLGFNARAGIPLSPEEVRHQHPELGKEFVEVNWDLLNLPDKRFGEVLGQIIKYHTKSTNIQSIPETFEVIQTVPLRLLVALIRLADSLDCDFRRAQWYNEDYRIYPDEVTRTHQRACELVDSVTFYSENKTVFVNCHALSLSDRRIAFWKFSEDICVEFDEIKDILQSNDVKWVFLKLRIINEPPLSCSEAKREFIEIQKMLSSLPSLDVFRRKLHEFFVGFIIKYFPHRTQYAGYYADERKTVSDIFKSNLEECCTIVRQKICFITLNSHVETRLRDALKEFETNAFAKSVIIFPNEINDIALALTESLANRLDDITTSLYKQSILGYLSTYHKISLADPRDFKARILDCSGDNLCVDARIRAMNLGVFVIDTGGSLVRTPPKYHLSQIATLLTTTTDLVGNQISAMPNSPAVASTVSTLIGHAIRMPFNECESYLYQAIHSILSGAGLLTRGVSISRSAFDRRKSKADFVISRFDEILPLEKIFLITDELARAVCNYDDREQKELQDVELSFSLYENLIFLVLEVYGKRNLLKESGYSPPSVDMNESLIRMFALWPGFSALPEKFQTLPALSLCLLAYAFVLYGFDDAGFSKFGEDLNTSSP